MQQKGTIAPHKINFRFMHCASPHKRGEHVYAATRNAITAYTALNQFMRQDRYAASQYIMPLYLPLCTSHSNEMSVVCNKDK